MQTQLETLRLALPDFFRIPVGEALELSNEAGWAAWDLVTRMEDVLQAGSAPRGERWGEDRDTDYERAYGPCLTWN